MTPSQIETGLLCYYYTVASRGDGWTANLGCVQLTGYYEPGVTFDITLQGTLISIATAPVVLLNFALLMTVLYIVVPLARQEQGKTGTPLFPVLIRDGVMYFVLAFSSTLLTSLGPIIFSNQPRAVSLGEPWFQTIAPIAANRIFLNLRSVMAKEKSAGTDSSPTPSTVWEATAGTV
ncbi:hypothetical protein CALCODRAFT_74491 [Calocera cornea HHB12733]|uniref:Uncharacterized protein n=1 Tax=Calocera cornea HHB12733 TaxID=1353952 RepID=A0A165DI31_9BASI|nr:hypothetical protein CALCODRAFT_74491 [Calocera cornea HHB12733]